jgi:hypothetical protein
MPLTMKRNLALISLLLAAIGLASAPAKSKKHASLPEEFESAHTVFVESRDGDITDLRLDPEDRNAILDMQDALQDWGRYTLSRSRRDADLILVLHKGRVWRDQSNTASSAGPHLSTSHTPIQDPADASQGPGNNNSPDGLKRENDELRVYTIQSDGKLKGPIWRDDLERGLNTPSILLLQRLKLEVEKAYPAAPANKQPTP